MKTLSTTVVKKCSLVYILYLFDHWTALCPLVCGPRGILITDLCRGDDKSRVKLWVLSRCILPAYHCILSASQSTTKGISELNGLIYQCFTAFNHLTQHKINVDLKFKLTLFGRMVFHSLSRTYNSRKW